MAKHEGSFRLGLLVGLALAGGASCAASAESLHVSGVYASRADMPGDVRLIVTERFGGDAGPDLLIALSDELAQASIGGESYFQVLPALGGATGFGSAHLNPTQRPSETDAPDAILRGSVRAEVLDIASAEKVVRECRSRDEHKKCIEHEEIRVSCRELRVMLIPRIVLLTTAGQTLYSERSNWRDAATYCADDPGPPLASDMIDGLIESLARSVRLDLAPLEKNEDIRLMESRKEIARDDRVAFRDALRRVRIDPFGACMAFQALATGSPRSVAVLFNIGLCAESQGRLEDATRFYDRALALDPDRDYPLAGLGRVSSRIRANNLLTARNGT